MGFGRLQKYQSNEGAFALVLLNPFLHPPHDCTCSTASPNRQFNHFYPIQNTLLVVLYRDGRSTIESGSGRRGGESIQMLSKPPSQQQLLIRQDQRPEILRYRLYAPYKSLMRAGHDLPRYRSRNTACRTRDHCVAQHHGTHQTTIQSRFLPRKHGA
jgi:hypothetical protein